MAPSIPHTSESGAARKAQKRSFRARARATQRDALPLFVPPCLATLSDTAPEGGDWVHEVKFDGYRLQARIDHGRVQLLTRSGQDWTHRFGGLARALGSLKVETALIDGEAAVEDEGGTSSFVRLVEALRAGRSGEMVYYAFDLIYLDGTDLTRAPLIERKTLLEAVLKKAPTNGPLRYSAHFATDGPAMLQAACSHGLEGIISKRRDMPYRSGRRDDWLKSKCIQTDEFAIGGYLDSSAHPKAIGALVLGYYRRGSFIYAGRVGTGFNRQSAGRLWMELQALRIAKPAFGEQLTAQQRRGVRWVKPQLVAQIEYRAWTGDGLLRHATFKALREDKPAREVRAPKSKGARI